MIEKQPEHTKPASPQQATPVDAGVTDTGKITERLLQSQEGPWRTKEQESLFPDADEDMEVEVLDATETMEALLRTSARHPQQINTELAKHGIGEADIEDCRDLTIPDFCQKKGITLRDIEDIFWVHLTKKPQNLIVNDSIDDLSPAPERATELVRAQKEGMLPRPDQAAYERDIERRRSMRAEKLGNPQLTPNEISQMREQYALLLDLPADATWQRIIEREDRGI